MPVRLAMLWTLLLVAFAMGGCARMPLDWMADGAVGASGDVAAMHQDAEADAIIARAEAASVRYASPAGHVIEASSSLRPYLLDTGDRLRVFVYGQPNLSRLYIVDQSGSISVPLIGGVRARGVSTYQLEGAIRSRLGQSLVRDPQVTVDVQQNRPFFILGEVRNAGQYPYVTGMTVETAVAIAGGFGERASERKARLSRRSGSAMDSVDVPLDTEIEPGDTVYIYERFF